MEDPTQVLPTNGWFLRHHSTQHCSYQNGNYCGYINVRGHFWAYTADEKLVVGKVECHLLDARLPKA